MTYPGSPELSAQAQERVMSAFRQVVTKIQEGLSNEALIGLEFVLRLDPTFAPGVALQKQLVSGQSDIDLSNIISQIEAPDTGAINLLLIEAVEEFNQHNYLEAKEKIEKILIDLPGHQEARALASQVDDALKMTIQVGQFLAQAREALAEKRPQDAANFVLMAQALDPHHSGIEATLAEIHRSGGVDVSTFNAPPAPPTARPADGPLSGPADVSPSEGFSTVVIDPAQPESDSWDVAGAFEDPAFEPVDAPSPEPEEPTSFDFGGDVADLFEASSDAPLWDEPAPAAPSETAGPGPEEELLVLGTAALDRGDPQEALHHLSKVLLIDPENTQVGALIDRAKSGIDTMEQRLQASLSEAEMALDSGDTARAQALVDEILLASPGNQEALSLKDRLEHKEFDTSLPPETPDEPLMAPEVEAAPSLDEGEFDDLGSFDDFDSTFDPSESDLPETPAQQSPVGLSKRQVPWRLIIMGAGGVAIVLLGMWLGSKFLPHRDGDIDSARAVTEVIESAQLLLGQGKEEEALALLRSFDATGLDKARIDKHITRIEAALAPPEPTPVPESVQLGRSLVDENRWLEAYQVITDGLSRHPEDSGLLSLKQRVSMIEPDLTALFASLQKKDFQTGMHIAEELVVRHPDQVGFGNILDRCLFNAALNHLRTYNLTSARGYLRRLQDRHPDDTEVTRILGFISSYTNRPVDMQLEIFVGSIDFR